MSAHGFREESLRPCLGDAVHVHLPGTLAHGQPGYVDRIVVRDGQALLQVFCPDLDELSYLYLYPWEVT